MLLPNNVKIVDEFYQLDKNSNPLDKEWFFYIYDGSAILCNKNGKKPNFTPDDLDILKNKLYPNLISRKSEHCIDLSNELDEEAVLWYMAGNPYRNHVWKVQEGTYDYDKIANFWEKIKLLSDSEQIKSEFLSIFSSTINQLKEFNELKSKSL